jgi:hypothetical protein
MPLFKKIYGDTELSTVQGPSVLETVVIISGDTTPTITTHDISAAKFSVKGDSLPIPNANVNPLEVEGGGIVFNELNSAPSVGGTNKGIIYLKNDKGLYYINQDGTNIPLALSADEQWNGITGDTGLWYPGPVVIGDSVAGAAGFGDLRVTGTLYGDSLSVTEDLSVGNFATITGGLTVGDSVTITGSPVIIGDSVIGDSTMFLLSGDSATTTSFRIKNKGDSDIGFRFQTEYPAHYSVMWFDTNDGDKNKYMIAYGDSHTTLGKGFAMKNNMADGFLSFHVTSGEIVRITSSGLGIGDTSPIYSITSNGGTTNALRAIGVGVDGTGAAQQAMFMVMSQYNGVGLGAAGNKGWQFGARGDSYANAAEVNDFNYWYWDGSSWTNGPTFQTNGYVGFNETEPDKPLHITFGDTDPAIKLEKITTDTGSGTIVYNSADASIDFIIE